MLNQRETAALFNKANTAMRNVRHNVCHAWRQKEEMRLILERAKRRSMEKKNHT